MQKGSVEVASGQSVDITVTAGQAGTFPVDCTHFMPGEGKPRVNADGHG